MRIDKDLCLVIPIDRDDGTRIYVHSVPVSFELFEAYHQVLGRAFAMLGQLGLGIVAGPQQAMLLVEDAAKSLRREPADDGRPRSWWEGADGVELGLKQEIIRLSNVLQPAEDGRGGWTHSPLSDAIRSGWIDVEEVASVLNQAAFFTLAWRAGPRADRRNNVAGAASIYGSLLTSLACMEYAASLRISTAAVTGEPPVPPGHTATAVEEPPVSAIRPNAPARATMS